MKTPVQELIEYIEEFTPKNKTTDGIWSKAKSLLDKEEEIITESHLKGIDCGIENGIAFHDLYSKKYFNETFNNQ